MVLSINSVYNSSGLTVYKQFIENSLIELFMIHALDWQCEVGTANFAVRRAAEKGSESELQNMQRCQSRSHRFAATGRSRLTNFQWLFATFSTV